MKNESMFSSCYYENSSFGAKRPFFILHFTYIAACGVVLQARANKRTKKMASELA